ncbi:MAG TPA: hypothetical protein PLZ43_12875 [bacterium]|jgi:hypothetical protein|nr:hypothetical protein [bacterium]
MGLFSKSYKPGGIHHVRITDSVFESAQKMIKNNDEVKKKYLEVAKEISEKYDCAKYEAHDFPVKEILGVFFIAYELQEEASGIPENMRVSNIQIGRKDLVEYNKFVDQFNSQLESKAEYEEEKWNNKGLGGKLFSMAANAATQGIKKAATGKSEDVRFFEKSYANYICGDSETAKNYLLNFAAEFGGNDEGLVNLAKAIRENFWMSEFAKYNRNR